MNCQTRLLYYWIVVELVKALGSRVMHRVTRLLRAREILLTLYLKKMITIKFHPSLFKVTCILFKLLCITIDALKFCDLSDHSCLTGLVRIHQGLCDKSY